MYLHKSGCELWAVILKGFLWGFDVSDNKNAEFNCFFMLFFQPYALFSNIINHLLIKIMVYLHKWFP